VGYVKKKRSNYLMLIKCKCNCIFFSFFGAPEKVQQSEGEEGEATGGKGSYGRRLRKGGRSQ